MNVFSYEVRLLGHKNKKILCTKAQSKCFCNLNREGLHSQSLYLADKYASYLENCSDVLFLRKLHARIFAFGLGNNIFLGSKLLNCYAKFGFLVESRWVCNRIVNDKLSLWNSILVGYFRSGHFHEVLRRYSSLRRRKIGLDSSGITFGLKSCIELGSMEFGRGLHVDAFKFGLSGDRFVGSSLIGLYFECGDVHDASKAFDEITERDVVIYTSMITGYAQIRDHRAYKAFRVAQEMQKDQLDPNRVTLVSLLQAAAHLEAHEEGCSVHGYAMRRGINCSDEVFETSLMDMYIKCRNPRMAACIFGKMKTRTVASWNAVIAGYVQMGKPLKALNLFCLMVGENILPDLITLASVISGCASLMYMREGKSIHGYLTRMGVQLDLVATTGLIDMYCKYNNLIQARKLFDRMESRDVVSFNVMMAGFLQNGFVLEAIQTLHEMLEAGISPNIGTILSILSASSDLKDIRQGRSVHGYVLRYGFESNIEIINQIIYMYSNCGFIDYAWKVFGNMEYRDLVSWTSMMMGYVYHGHADEAVTLFRLMQKENLAPDAITLVSLLQAFAQLGCLSLAKEVHCCMYRVLMEGDRSMINSLVSTYAKCGKLNMARNLFESMKEKCLASWNTIIAAYGMHGNCAEAINLFDEMRKEKVAPDEVTFTSILSACSHAGLVGEGLHFFNSMTEFYSIIPCEEHYGCMVDLLSRAGRLEEAYDLIKCLPPRRSASALGSLLAACRIHSNTEMGEVIGRRLLDLVPEYSSAYASVSNFYAESGKWDEVARIRAMAKEIGLEKSPGHSFIELENRFRKDSWT